MTGLHVGTGGFGNERAATAPPDAHGRDARSIDRGRPENVVQVLEALAREAPDRVALSIPPGSSRLVAGERVTYAELDALVSRLAWGLQSKGVERGQRAAIAVPFSVDLYLLMLALFKLAATAIFMDPAVGLGAISRFCRAVRPEALVLGGKGALLPILSRSFAAIPLKLTTAPLLPVPGGTSVQSLLPRAVPAIAAVAPPEGAPALVTFSSGSTGRPKAIGRTHDFLWTQHRVLASVFPSAPSDVELSLLPLFVLHSLAAGVTAVLPASTKLRRSAVAAWIAQIRQHHVTTIRAGPSSLWGLARVSRERDLRLDSVTGIFTGGAPVSAGLIRALKAIAPRSEVQIVYGSTEAEPIAHIAGGDALATMVASASGRGICVGQPVESIRLRLGGDRASSPRVRQDEPSAEPAEVQVTGEHVNSTYFEDPAAVALYKVIDADGTVWHKTGDLGYLDARGRLWLVGREATRVVRAGRTLHPFQVQGLIEALPGVRRCALVAVPGGRGAERAILAVVPAGAAKSDGAARLRLRGAIVERCLEHGLAVDDVLFRNSLPVDRRLNAKIDYRELRRWCRRPGWRSAIS